MMLPISVSTDDKVSHANKEYNLEWVKGKTLFHTMHTSLSSKQENTVLQRALKMNSALAAAEDWHLKVSHLEVKRNWR